MARHVLMLLMLYPVLYESAQYLGLIIAEGHK